jgi:SAM-dependent methyltransferase
MSFTLFDFTGFAARTDIEENDWKEAFDRLEQEQSEFLQYESKFRSKEYRWPRDPLHSWSRLWEYPYVYHHINRIHTERPGRKLELIDFGSGVTFFPFALSKLDCNVTCVDIDPIVAVDIPRAAEVLKPALGHVKVALIKNGCIPVESKSQDVVYGISVLAHIKKFEWVIDEILRVLKPDGQLILTVDRA